MAILMGLVPWVIIGLTLFIAYKTKHNVKKCITVLGVGILTFLLYQKIQPSYLPKGTVIRSEVPAFEQKDVKIKDIQRKPMSIEERDARLKELYKEGVPYKQTNSSASSN